MRNFNGKMVVYDLRETYSNVGKFHFKIVLGKSFKNGHEIDIKMYDSKNEEMELTSETWGRKVNCEFTIPESAQDGVHTVKIKLLDMIEVLQYWVIR